MAKIDKNETKSMFKSAREGAKDGSGGIEMLPPGKYNAKLTTCEFYESQNGARYIRHFWTILEGSLEGKKAQDYRKVENENGIKYTLMEWNKLGADVESVEDYDSLAKTAEWVQAQGFICRIRIAQNKNNPDFQNFYIEEVLDQDGAPDGGSESEADADTDPEGGEPDGEGEESDEGVEVGDVVEFKHDGKVIQKAVISIDEDKGLIVVKVNKTKVELTVDDIIRKVTE